MKKKNPHAVALGRKGGRNSGGKRHGAGRPRTDAPRCACGLMTAKLAAIRKHACSSVPAL